jgi:ribosomal protein S18 acetylase RimI-like enzyme
MQPIQTIEKPITITLPQNDQDLTEILTLQQENLRSNVSDETKSKQGFVTVEHSFELLKSMHQAEPAAIAKAEGHIVGYCLAMPDTFRYSIPVLAPMFEVFDQIKYQEKLINEYAYIVSGQVCVAKSYRGMGIFDQMYQALRNRLSSRYELMLTEVAKRNTRSIQAHKRIGFEKLHEYTDELETWEVVVWDWRK